MNNYVQNIPMNLSSLLLTMLIGMLHKFTICLQYSLVVYSVEHILGVGKNVAYFLESVYDNQDGFMFAYFREVCYEV